MVAGMELPVMSARMTSLRLRGLLSGTSPENWREVRAPDPLGPSGPGGPVGGGLVVTQVIDTLPPETPGPRQVTERPVLPRKDVLVAPTKEMVLGSKERVNW
jgi:hypothetical protein